MKEGELEVTKGTAERGRERLRERVADRDKAKY